MNITIDDKIYSFSEGTTSFVIFNYCSDSEIPGIDSVDALKEQGFTITNANGENIDFVCDNPKSPKEFKVKYNDISDISTMYLNYKDQKITIKVS
jgi:hypothetical protein